MTGRQIHRLEENICTQIMARQIEMLQEMSAENRYRTFMRRRIDRKRLNLRRRTLWAIGPFALDEITKTEYRFDPPKETS